MGSQRLLRDYILNKKNIFILLPAYNEEATLPKLLVKIQEFAASTENEVHTVVCDDCSSDDTSKAIEGFVSQMPLTILSHNYNRGLGETSRDLFEFAATKSSDVDYIVRMDADNTHSPFVITQMLAKIDLGYDVVIASRFQPGGAQKGVSTYRATISLLANIFMKCVFPIKGVKEYSCGYRCYRASLIKNAVDTYGNNFIQLKGLGFTGTLEKLVKLNLLGAKVAEVPFELRYDLKESQSKMVSSITTLGYLTMAVLYHWPWGGWRKVYKHLRGSSG